MKLIGLTCLTFALAFPITARALPQASSAPAQAPAAQAAAPVTLDLSKDVDNALRWLRSMQDRESGGYGPDVETTATVLRAMIQSHRHYQRIDGPFVERALEYLASRQAADGSIHDASAKDAATIVRQTSMAAGALALHSVDTTDATLGKALAFLGKSSANPSPWVDEALPESREALRAKAQELLAKRGADGAWDGALGKVGETARAALMLVRAQPLLAPPAKKNEAAAKSLPQFEPADRAKAEAAIARGAAFLAKAGDKGRYGEPGKPDAGITAMAIGGLLAVPEPRAKEVQEAIDQGLAWLVSLQKPDGSIHAGQLANYCTSAAVMALARSKKPEYAPVIQKARDFLVALQLGPEEGYSESDPYYGGIGYGSSERPDLSNLQMALEALSASGLEKDHEAFQRALKFLERCQNRSESNDIAIPDKDGKKVVSGDDGGSAYLPGQSFAGYVELADGKKIPRSYGSMTYALLKGYAFAGLPKDDPRMKAAWEWLRKNYTLDVNPGFDGSGEPTAAYQGLFYYFHTMAKALDLYGEETIVDAQGKEHAWRKELAGRLVAMQRKDDGSWINENSPRWWEGNPVLATSYALSTLGTALPATQQAK